MAEITQSPSSPEDTFTSRKVLRHRLEQIGWVAVGLMLVVGVGSTINRMVFMAQAMAEPGSTYNAFDIRYVELPWASWLHLLPALLIALTGPTQFIRQVRKRYRGWHRLAGRIYLIAGLIGAVTGFVIGGLNPFMGLDGPGFNEAMATLVFSSLVIWVLLSAYSAARRRNLGHRPWRLFDQIEVTAKHPVELLKTGRVAGIGPFAQIGEFRGH